MSKDASAGEKPPAPTQDAPHTNHDDRAPSVVVHQTHEVTRRGIETQTTLETPDDVDAIPEAVADQLRLAFDIDPHEHDPTDTRPRGDGGFEWSYATHALTRLSRGDGA
ncbi:hypothetical protein [Halorubellus sp. PRR65]|uniref:hypothetical protein n=1 Tax=Halorubellus sp. PRR65 TaxID=3098148 RepID=UPI002B2588DF|nr:hypothetical protein [Halorubellus sp. PRR65]